MEDEKGEGEAEGEGDRTIRRIGISTPYMASTSYRI